MLDAGQKINERFYSHKASFENTRKYAKKNCDKNTLYTQTKTK